MKKGDLAGEHREKMQKLHALFTKKTQYHHQKAYLELKDIYWLVHEFFEAFLDKQKHFTEEEIEQELRNFKHDYFEIGPDTVSNWQTFFRSLSAAQYAGRELSQDELHSLVVQFGTLVDLTIGREQAPQDAFTRQVQATKIFVQSNDLEKAEQAYKKLMQVYESFDNDRKRKHYAELERLYEAIAALRSAPQVSRQ